LYTSNHSVNKAANFFTQAHRSDDIERCVNARYEPQCFTVQHKIHYLTKISQINDKLDILVAAIKHKHSMSVTSC